MNDFHDIKLTDDNFVNIDPAEAQKEYTYQKALKAAQYEASQPKLMIQTKQSTKKFDKVMSDLKYLLDQEDYEYTINTQRYKSFPQKITIIIEVESFGACANDYIIFKDIVNSIDSFDSEGTPEGKVKYYFGINDMYTNALEKKKK